jgi:hypothetical protein
MAVSILYVNKGLESPLRMLGTYRSLRYLRGWMMARRQWELD